jgi:peptidoglycan/LPS O-acetylase OafA/YrhL
MSRSADVWAPPAVDTPATAVTDDVSTPVAPRRHGPIPSLDGLRALAVLIVVVSHAGYGETIPGGLGVTIFFFLSGYLITTLLLDEWNERGSVNVGHFYGRRAFRLLPSLFVTLAIAYLLVAIGTLDGGMSWQGLGSQIFYFANYYTIFYDHGGTVPEGTGVLWSLAVEEHFYILFPLFMWGVLRFANARRVLIGVFVTVCALALVWRLWLVTRPGFVDLRTYYGSDTRVDSILYGVLLAMCLNPARVPLDRVRDKMNGRDWALVAGGAVLLLGTILYRQPEFRESFRYSLQGLALVPIFYFAVRFPNSGPFKLLSARFLVRIGVLSYGIYLIHDVVLSALPTSVNIPNWARFGIALAVSVAFAALLDRFLDPYFRRRRAALR